MSRFDYVAGIGGIGKGILFRFLQDGTLGRNESRLAELSPARDYCKLHIILHYAARFLAGQCPVYPIGVVGADANGRELLRCMEEGGLSTDFIQAAEGADTMYSVCFMYPNGDGGNITTLHSAGDLLSTERIDGFFRSGAARGRGLLLAAPEVSVPVRKYFLAEGRRRGCYTAASFGAAEVADFLGDDTLKQVDLLALNMEEAAAVAGAGEGVPFACGCRVSAINPGIALMVTGGAEGAHLFWKGRHVHCPSLQVPVVNTAGAGDCLLGTLLSAVALHIPLYDEATGRSPALELAVACAAMKVTEMDSIHFGITARTLSGFLKERHITMEETYLQRLSGQRPRAGGAD